MYSKSVKFMVCKGFPNIYTWLYENSCLISPGSDWSREDVMGVEDSCLSWMSLWCGDLTLFSQCSAEISKTKSAHVTTRMNLENITLNEKCQMKKDKDCVTALIWGISCSQIHRDREENGGCQGLGGGETGSQSLMVTQFQLEKMKQF